MELKELADLVDTMIVQHDYPGFEPRRLHLGLPPAALQASTDVYVAGLKHESVFVQLASLRWFQSHVGLAKKHLPQILELLQASDEYVRAEAAKTIERAGSASETVLLALRSCLADDDSMVRSGAAKAIGKLMSKSSEVNPELISALRAAANDPQEQVRRKAQKALRKVGAYRNSSQD
jgi:HEAT repeat protein